MSTFTPGPWQVHWGVDVTGYPTFFIHGLSGDAKRDIATLNATARLIAAAPELLEALADSMPLIEDAAHSVTDGDARECQDLCGNALCSSVGCVLMKLKHARTALAKDRGETA